MHFLAADDRRFTDWVEAVAELPEQEHIGANHELPRTFSGFQYQLAVSRRICEAVLHNRHPFFLFEDLLNEAEHLRAFKWLVRF